LRARLDHRRIAGPLAFPSGKRPPLRPLAYFPSPLNPLPCHFFVPRTALSAIDSEVRLGLHSVPDFPSDWRVLLPLPLFRPPRFLGVPVFGESVVIWRGSSLSGLDLFCVGSTPLLQPMGVQGRIICFSGARGRPFSGGFKWQLFSIPPPSVTGSSILFRRPLETRSQLFDAEFRHATLFDSCNP